uniref:RRM domain-containing protein n=1 Tax=Trichobilharzia regenti TaxID=157069 RepID=A0AA85JB97_TRIRE|nr:unnamed protein product [Trichobilharzia regenti]
MDIRPNHTLYVNNLNDKVKKNDLKRALYYIFGQHGRLIDIIAMKTMKMRGQAFIIYQEITCATQAYRSLQGFQLFQRPMRVTYAKKDSQQIISLKGVSAEVQKRREEEREKRKRKKMAQRAAAAAAALQAANQSVNGPAGTGGDVNACWINLITFYSSVIYPKRQLMLCLQCCLVNSPVLKKLDELLVSWFCRI